MKRLFLASQADESINDIEKFVGGLKDKKIAFIGTAANGNNSYGQWKTLRGSYNLLKSKKLSVAPIELEDYKDKSVVKELLNTISFG